MSNLQIDKNQALRNYIDKLYFYSDKSYEKTKLNLKRIISGDKSAILPIYSLSTEEHVLSNDETFEVLNQALQDSLSQLNDLDILIYETIEANNIRRFNGEMPISVRNRYMDINYYNYSMLEYLKEEIGPVTNILMIIKIKLAEAKIRRSTIDYRHEDICTGIDFSPVYDMEFKEYYLPKFIEKYHLKEKYEMEVRKYREAQLTPITYEQFIFQTISLKMEVSNYQRKHTS